MKTKNIYLLLILTISVFISSFSFAEIRRGSNKEMLISANVKVLQVKKINAAIGKEIQKQKVVTRITVKILDFKDLNRAAQAFPVDYTERRDYLKSNLEEIDLIVDWAGEKLYIDQLNKIKPYDLMNLQIGIGKCQIEPKVGRRNPPRYDAYLVGIIKQKK